MCTSLEVPLPNFGAPTTNHIAVASSTANEARTEMHLVLQIYSHCTPARCNFQGIRITACTIQSDAVLIPISLLLVADRFLIPQIAPASAKADWLDTGCTACRPARPLARPQLHLHGEQRAHTCNDERGLALPSHVGLIRLSRVASVPSIGKRHFEELDRPTAETSPTGSLATCDKAAAE
eukprot:5454610-Pleurochrysis_carterae.AAC.4